MGPETWCLSVGCLPYGLEAFIAALYSGQPPPPGFSSLVSELYGCLSSIWGSLVLGPPAAGLGISQGHQEGREIPLTPQECLPVALQTDIHSSWLETAHPQQGKTCGLTGPLSQLHSNGTDRRARV